MLENINMTKAKKASLNHLDVMNKPVRAGAKQDSERNIDGTFKKGVSGNSKGREPGKTASAKLRKAIEAESDDIIKVLVEQAKSGDTPAAKVLLDRIVPALKPQALPINIPTGETLPETGSHVIDATMTGNIPPDIGAQLIRALSDQSKLVELEEMSQRLARIEKQLAARQ